MVATVPQSGALTSTEFYTAERYLHECKLDWSELIEGRVVELMPPGFEHGDIAAALIAILREFVKARGLGKVCGEVGFVLARNPDTVRAPDVAFLRTSRLPLGAQARSFIEGAPTLAIEIFSPEVRHRELEAKVQLYLQNGTEQVWIVYPDNRTILVRQPDDSTVEYGENDILSGGDILPGFSLQVRAIFE